MLVALKRLTLMYPHRARMWRIRPGGDLVPGDGEVKSLWRLSADGHIRRVPRCAARRTITSLFLAKPGLPVLPSMVNVRCRRIDHSDGPPEMASTACVVSLAMLNWIPTPSKLPFSGSFTSSRSSLRMPDGMRVELFQHAHDGGIHGFCLSTSSTYMRSVVGRN